MYVLQYLESSTCSRPLQLSPSDDDMERGLAKYHANMKDKMAAAQSSGGPSMGDAAPLRDGGPSYRTPAPTSKPRAGEALKPTPTATVREPVPQKLNVLRTLVGMGALRPAFLILSKFEWLPDAYPEVADQFLYMVNASLAPLITPRSTKEATVQRKNKPLSERTIVEAGMAPTAVPKKRQLVASCPLPRSNNYTEFVYFYPAWLDTLPLCTTGREIFTVIEPLLRFTGIQCYRDIDLLTKLCRLGKSQLSEVSKSECSCSPNRPTHSSGSAIYGLRRDCRTQRPVAEHATPIYAASALADTGKLSVQLGDLEFTVSFQFARPLGNVRGVVSGTHEVP